MKGIVFTLLGLLLFTCLCSQVVTTNPSLPLENQPVTLVFDATQGTGGLKNYSGDVYAHIGVITHKSSSGSDWQYVKTKWGENSADTKMTRVQGENNLYELELSPSIREYFGVPTGEVIRQIALVFRSGQPYSGSSYYEGKDTGGKDIYVDVFQEGLSVSVVNPAGTLIEEPSVDINFSASSTVTAKLILYLGDNVVKSLNGTEISHVFSFPESGDYWLKVTAALEDELVADSVFVHIMEEQPVGDLPEGLEAGINYGEPGEVSLVLFAPDKEYVFVSGDFNTWTPSAAYRMIQDGDYFWLTLDGLADGQEYAYQYFVDGELFIADPFATKVLDPWNDKWIEEETYPDLKEYPTGMADGIVSVFETGQEAYIWQHEFNSPPKENLVIYELLVRDFVEAHDWKTLTDTLDYFTRLGVNAIELMPFNEFEGNESWGYNPSFYFAPDKYYGPEEDLKAFIDSCHGRGIAVIMDMVLNHSYGQSPLVQLYRDDQNSRPSPDNPWYNVQSPNPVFSWGYDFDHESAHTQEFVDRVNRYWIEEYRVDGFRFDFTKGFTNTTGDGGSYDAARIAILKRMAAEIWRVDPESYVILEHFAPDAEEKELTDYGMMVWGNMNHSYNEATMGYNEEGKSNFNRISWKIRGFGEPGLVGYMESHDEERLMYKNLQFGNSAGDYDITDFETALRRVELANLFFIPVPGPKMIWQFGEMGYDFSIDFNGRVGNKPIRWDYYYSRPRLRELVSALNHLKISEPAFATDDFGVSATTDFKRVQLNHEDMDVRILGNFDLTGGAISASFSGTGTWYEYFSGEELEVEDPYMMISLEPGEYRMYTTKKLKAPELPTSVDDESAGETMARLYPNPVADNLWLTHPSGIHELEIFDLQGRKLRYVEVNALETVINAGDLKTGGYVLSLGLKDGTQEFMKFMKK